MANSSFLHHSAWQHHQALEKKEYSAKELVLACLEQVKKHQKLGTFLRYDEEKILKQAEDSDVRRSKGKNLGLLDGIPVSIKDNICQQGTTVSCASRILENFISPYDATVIEKLRAAGAVLFGQTNMDEFAMGSSTENSAFKKTHNPWHTNCVPGGSSGGAAVSVATCMTPLALGSDTGGSVRQPGSFCGVVGMRPTYGRVSRYGLVAFASSLDQIGPLGRSVGDCAMLLAAINGHDRLDTTSHPQADANPVAPSIKKLSSKKIQGLRVGVILPDSREIQADVSQRTTDVVQWLTSQGAKQVSLQPKLEESVISIYYILATAEASSNLGRYDGVRYGRRSQNVDDIKELYIRSRTEGFGAEVRRRILLGTFVLSSGYYDAYYKKAQAAREMIKQEYEEFFRHVDVIISPTAPATAFQFGECQDPLAMYRSDLLTIPPSLANLPCISIPVGLDQPNTGLPIGIQLIAPAFADQFLLEVAMAIEQGMPDLAMDYTRF